MWAQDDNRSGVTKMNKELNWSDIVDQLSRECHSDYDYDDDDDEWQWLDGGGE